MSPKRGDRVTVPLQPTNGICASEQARRCAVGKICAASLWPTPGDASRSSEASRAPAPPQRQHRLRGDLATRRHNGHELEQWEYEVTSGGRVRYVIDDDARVVWVIYASPRLATPRTPTADSGYPRAVRQPG
ncbi:hypothetical protein GCM10022254_25370 [Actinomadura meridiana]|uniref:Uncharacterized protein n=1 Tax=Actinomadura meridiana TaxID=559626 RepID=A0ABP8BYI3_9ACTN